MNPKRTIKVCQRYCSTQPGGNLDTVFDNVEEYYIDQFMITYTNDRENKVDKECEKHDELYDEYI